MKIWSELFVHSVVVFLRQKMWQFRIHNSEFTIQNSQLPQATTQHLKFNIKHSNNMTFNQHPTTMEDISITEMLRQYYSRMSEKEVTPRQSTWITVSILSFMLTILPLPCPEVLRMAFIGLFAFSLWRCKKNGL